MDRESQLKLPADFDFQQKITDFQFAIMIKIKYGLEKRLAREEKMLHDLLHSVFTDKSYIDKIKRKIQLAAYYDIPGEFWKNIKK